MPVKTKDDDVARLSEIEQVEEWRREELKRVGLSEVAAGRIAVRHDIDLHRAAKMFLQGCNETLLLEILL